MAESTPVNQGLTFNRRFRAGVIFLISSGALLAPFVFRKSKAALLAFLLVYVGATTALIAIATLAYKRHREGDNRSIRQIMDEFFRP